MPYFYHDLALNDPASTISLYQYMTIGKYEEICRCVSDTKPTMSATMSWSTYDMDFDPQEKAIMNDIQDIENRQRARREDEMKKIRAEHRKRSDASRNIIPFTEMAAKLTTPMYKLRKFNNNLSQEVVVTATDSYKKYDGSSYNLPIPSARFVFFNTGDHKAYLEQVFLLLNAILPFYVRDKDTGIGKSGRLDKDSNTGYFRIERAPNNFTTPNAGFDFSQITGDFNLRVGYDYFTHVVPSDVSVEKSDDYDIVPASELNLSNSYEDLKLVTKGIEIAKNAATWLAPVGMKFLTRMIFGAAQAVSEKIEVKRAMKSNNVMVPNSITVTVNFDWATKFVADDMFKFALASGDPNATITY